MPVDFTLAVAMTQPEHYTALARQAEARGFAQVAVPDSLFWSEHASDLYPYTPDGSRMWSEHTPFPDPFQAIAAMGAVTERIRFCTYVVKVGVRNALHLAKQVSTAAVLTGNRFTFGAGIGWLREEFEWCGQPFEQRGARVDETLHALRQVLSGEWTSFDGDHVSFGRLRMPPAPTERVPLWIGGHTAPAIRRTIEHGDGWTSAMITFDDARDIITRIRQGLEDAGRDPDDFAFQVSSIDRFDLDGYRELADIGVTDIVTIPWLFQGVPIDGPLDAKLDGIAAFKQDVIDRW
jgi:probable F420-dependent oxidoreductase